MSKISATLVIGIALGLGGALAYRRLREIEAEESAEILLSRICNHLLELEIAKNSENAIAVRLR